MFILMKRYLLRLLEAILERLARAIYPASEKIRSDGTDVAGVCRTALAAWNKQWKLRFM